MRLRFANCAFAAVAAASHFIADRARAEDDVAKFYKGKTITIVVGYAAGGGADLWGRFVARHLGKFVPGNPNVIVQNMPGAGGFAAVNHVYNNAVKDGTVIILPTSTAIAAPLMGTPNVRWDTFKFNWLVNLTRDVASCMASGKSGIKSFWEAEKRVIVFGGDGVDDPAAYHPRLPANLRGYKIKVVMGYKGTGPTMLAVERGEVDAVCAVWASLALANFKEQMDAGKLVPILQVGTRKHPAFGNAPLVSEFAQNDEQRAIVRFIVGPVEISRPFAAPPGVPPARVAALREALWNAAHSEALLADAKKMKLTIDPMKGEETEAALRSALEVSSDIVAKAKKAILE
jgi:tripartite-type tricarboxylate transporter receptor subunit TctC